MHRAKNMVGEMTANYDVSLFKRYFRMSKHVKPGFIRKSIIVVTAALEMRVGVLLYV